MTLSGPRPQRQGHAPSIAVPPQHTPRPEPESPQRQVTPDADEHKQVAQDTHLRTPLRVAA